MVDAAAAGADFLLMVLQLISAVQKIRIYNREVPREYIYLVQQELIVGICVAGDVRIFRGHLYSEEWSMAGECGNYGGYGRGDLADREVEGKARNFSEASVEAVTECQALL